MRKNLLPKDRFLEEDIEDIKEPFNVDMSSYIESDFDEDGYREMLKQQKKLALLMGISIEVLMAVMLIVLPKEYEDLWYLKVGACGSMLAGGMLIRDGLSGRRFKNKKEVITTKTGRKVVIEDLNPKKDRDGNTIYK